MSIRRLAIIGALVHVQGPSRVMELPPHNAVLDAEFTRIAAVRELADGRVLVSDAGERKLYAGDFTARTATVKGREGEGPGEYRSVGQLFALAGDSTLMVDVPGGRWLLLHGSEIVQTVSADAPVLRDGFRLPSGADARGFIIATRAMGVPARPGAELPRLDSTHLLRVSRISGRTDTLATLQARRARINVAGPRTRPTSIEVRSNPLAAGDLTAMFEDGAIAIARVNPYRVDWILPDGRRIAGGPVPYTAVPVTDREKRAVLSRQAALSGRAAVAPESVPDWPEVIPPFVTGAVLAAPDGRLWIRRTPTAAAPETVYDVIDRNGTLVTRVRLSPNEHIAGIGRRGVYSVYTDDDGVQRLRRHAAVR
jgi:hypothetical protein